MEKTWKYLLYGLILTILIISGFAIAKHYGFKLVNVTIFQSNSQKKEQKLELKEKLEYEMVLRELQKLERQIKQTEVDLIIIFNEMNMRVTPVAREEKEVSYKNQSFKWVQQTFKVDIPTFARHPQEVFSVKAELLERILEKGGILVKEERNENQETIRELLYFGVTGGDISIVSHQLVLEKIKPKAQLAIVIDDLGYHWPKFDVMMKIPRPVTFAVLPHLPESSTQANRVLQEGYDLILHQPMEPTVDLNPGEGAIYTQMSDDEIVQTLTDNLASLPEGLIGVNNHMGSKATGDTRVMRTVLKYFKEQQMFFVDSSTSPESVVATVAREINEPYQVNNIFLDNVDQLEDIKVQLLRAGRIALQNGQAIAIGHVRNYTGEAILAVIDDLENMGVQLVYVKDILN